MFDTVLYTHVKTNIFTAYAFEGSFIEGSANKLKPPYIIMNKIDDQEQPQTMCQNQGNTGSALIQFSAYCGYTQTGKNSLKTKEYLNSFKEYFKNLRGIIGTTEQYRINYNFTSGVTALSDGVSSLETWGAIFQASIRWEKI